MCAELSAGQMVPSDSGRDSAWVRAVLWYQRLREGRPSPCRFFPSCSEYAVSALRLHGSRRGLWLTFRRLVKCRPFGPSGFDPVPEPSTVRIDGNALSRGGKVHV